MHAGTIEKRNKINIPQCVMGDVSAARSLVARVCCCTVCPISIFSSIFGEEIPRLYAELLHSTVVGRGMDRYIVGYMNTRAECMRLGGTF